MVFADLEISRNFLTRIFLHYTAYKITGKATTLRDVVKMADNKNCRRSLFFCLWTLVHNRHWYIRTSLCSDERSFVLAIALKQLSKCSGYFHWSLTLYWWRHQWLWPRNLLPRKFLHTHFTADSRNFLCANISRCRVFMYKSWYHWPMYTNLPHISCIMSAVYSQHVLHWHRYTLNIGHKVLVCYVTYATCKQWAINEL